MPPDPARRAGDQRHLSGQIEARQRGHTAVSLARWRNSYFWILPVEVFGKGPNTTERGALKWARLARHQATMSSSATGPASGFRVTKAQGLSPQTGSGLATTAASMICGWR